MKQSLTLNLSNQLNQQLTLTPQLKQSLKLLQLPSTDLETEIQLALDANPLLERVENDLASEYDIPTVAPALDNGIPQPISESADPELQMSQTDHLAPEQDLSLNYQESFEPRVESIENVDNINTIESGALSAGQIASNQNSDHSSTNSSEISQYTSQPESLFDHLIWQVQMTNLSEKDQLIARSILRSLDEDGYLITSLDDICAMFDEQLMVEKDEVQAVLSLIRTLDPLGVGATNLQDRLLILLEQISNNSQSLTIAKAIVSEHLDLLATRNLSKLKKALSINDGQLSKSLSLITRLNPRVAARFQEDKQNHITPDLIVKKIKEQWQVQINPDNQAKLRVNQTYSDLLKNDLAAQDNDYIQENLAQAKIFIKGLMSRYDTLLLVGQAILERQQQFFEHGEEHMQPMVLHDIATELDMHESTISRATAGKYLLSTRGVFELKYFFSSALSSTKGADSSSTAIRSLIKKMVESESKTKPLSDNKIAQELEQQGHIVARRTVAKYRESMHIAPSSQRKSLA